MFVVTQTQVDAVLYRYDDLLAEAARVRLIAATTQPSSAATPRPVARIRVGLRQAVSSLLALAAIG